MIPFFRRIRKQLANDNKPLKYLRYAIGEIILVVIGILIALQINNWNDSIKYALSEKEFIKSLELDLLRDKEFLTASFNDAKIRLSEINVLLEELSQISKSNQSLIDSLFIKHLIPIATFYPQSGSFETATSSGIFTNFKNKDLLAKVHNLYKTLYPRVVYNGELVDDRTMKLGEKYAHERRIGKLGEKNNAQISEIMDDVYRGVNGGKWRNRILSETLEVINIILSDISMLSANL